MVTLGVSSQDFQITTNWVAMIALGICLYYNKNVFTLLLGIVLITGNFTGLTAFGTVTHNSLFFNIGSLPIPLYWGSPIYSLLLIIYLVCNKGFFIGIATKEYWTDFLTRTKDLEPVFTTVNTKEPDELGNNT
jgi:hypothetical protein